MASPVSTTLCLTDIILRANMTGPHSNPDPRHYILIASASWGHARPELTLALRLLKFHPHLHITALVPDVVSERIKSLLSSCPQSEDESSRLEVRYCSFSSAPPGQHPSTVTEDNGLYRDFCFWLADEAKGWLRASLEDNRGERGEKKDKLEPSVVLTDEFPGMGTGTWGDLWVEKGLERPKVYVISPIGETFTAV